MEKLIVRHSVYVSGTLSVKARRKAMTKKESKVDGDFLQDCKDLDKFLCL